MSSGQYFGSEQALLALIKPLTDTGTPLNVTTHTRTGIEAALFWAGCSSETVAQCHLSPRGTMARSTFLAKSDFVAKPLSAAAVTTMVTAINARQANPTLGHGALLMDSYGGAINRVPKARRRSSIATSCSRSSTPRSTRPARRRPGWPRTPSG